jgi:pyruvate/2-oxoglutarate dehydrogenase complex dihydrolipoamide dehydrogenase (E3) component
MTGIEGEAYFTNSSNMDVEFLPRHLAIVGGGYVGPEFARMCSRFGSEVTIEQTTAVSVGALMERQPRVPS